MQRVTSLSVEVGFDLVCPWCLIGKRLLAVALERLRAERPDVGVEIAWRSYPLLPDIPKKGLPFADFYRQRLGSAAAVAMRQAQVREAARAAGVEVAFERIAVFPNTLDAHRLVAQAQRQGGSALAGVAIDLLFQRYFVQGRNIGDAAVLAEVRTECGIAPAAADEAEVPRAAGGFGVPYFRFNGKLAVEGAQRPEVLLQAMLQAL